MIKYVKKLKRKFIDSNDNNKSVFYNTLGAFAVKGGALIVSLLTLPAYIRYFDNQQVLGLWFTLLSVLSWVLTFDLGIGNGLRNYLVPALVQKDNLRIRKYISSAYVSIGFVVVVSSLVSLILFKFFNWNVIFNISDSVISRQTLSLSVWIIFLGILLQFILNLINSILYAMQKSALVSFLTLLSSIITLLYVLFAKTSDVSSNLITLSIVRVIAVNLPLLITTIIIFSKRLKNCSPRIKYFEKEYAKDIIKLGGVFLWVQIMYMILTATNEFLITWFSGPAMVVEYLIYYKLFTLISMIFMLALTPIWSAVTKAFSEKRYSWIRKLYKLLKYVAFVGMIFEFLIIIFLQNIINLWLGDSSIKVNYFYAFIFAVSGSILIWNGVFSSIANGLGKLRTQSILFTLGAIIKIPLAWILVKYFDSWIGVMIANIISIGLYCIIQPIILRKILNREEIKGEK